MEKAKSDVSAIKTKTSDRPSRPRQRNENSSQPRDRRSQSRNRQHFNKRNNKSSGYHLLELAPESRFITTFSTHVGLRRYKRLPFGINAASEIFQESMRELLTGLPGCKTISGDIIVLGKGKDKHDRNLRGVLQRLQDNNLHLARA